VSARGAACVTEHTYMCASICALATLAIMRMEGQAKKGAQCLHARRSLRHPLRLRLERLAGVVDDVRIVIALHLRRNEGSTAHIALRTEPSPWCAEPRQAGRAAIERAESAITGRIWAKPSASSSIT